MKSEWITQETWFPGHLKVLSRKECLDLLNATPVGRVAWNEPEGPIILPVNYVMDGTSIIFRTGIDTALARKLHLGFASFQIDEHDDFNRSGWSVLARGMVSCVDANHVTEDAPEVFPWVDGERHYMMRITPLVITGRRIIPT